MKCFFCEEEARGVCAFCGRGICKNHIEEGKNKVEGQVLIIGEVSGHQRNYRIKNVIKCKECEIDYYPKIKTK